MSQLVDVARREKERQRKEEEEAEKSSDQPGTPIVDPPTPIATENRDLVAKETEENRPRRTNSGRLKRQQHSVRDGEGWR